MLTSDFVSVWRRGGGGSRPRQAGQARKQDGGVVVRHVTRGPPVPRHPDPRDGHVTLVN